MADNNPNITILHDFSDVRVESRQRTSGKRVVTLQIESTPIICHHNPLELGKPVAEAIAATIQKQIRAINERASEATIRARKVAAKAFAAGERWAVKRYSGGRMGAMPPNQSDRAFNDSGRLASSVTARANEKEGGWTINVAANRLLPSDFKGDGFARMIVRLRELVPALVNPLAQREIVEAMQDTWKAMHEVRAMAAAEKQRALKGQWVREGLKVLRGLVAG